MRVRRKVIIGGIVLAGCLGSMAAACGGDATPAQKSENKIAGHGAQQLINNQPPPVFDWSQIRQNLIELEGAQAKGVQSTTLFFPEGSNGGNYSPIFSCPSIGAPIPSTDEITNPQQLTGQYTGQTGAIGGTISQMDPNGVYTGQSTGTYVLCVGTDGAVTATYWEGPVMSVFGAATWDDTTHQVKMVGAPTFKFTPIK